MNFPLGCMHALVISTCELGLLLVLSCAPKQLAQNMGGSDPKLFGRLEAEKVGSLLPILIPLPPGIFCRCLASFLE
jgi:hypothetical protein